MPLHLPSGHPLEAEVGRAPPAGGAGPTVRLGIVNLMPRGEVYEAMLARALSGVSQRVEPHFVRLQTHAYKSTDHAHLERWYRTFDRTVAATRLDALLVTGAPIEHLPLERVWYWEELRAVLTFARRSIGSTLGICWGAIALGGLLDLGREHQEEKIFGVYQHRVLPDGPPLLGHAPTFLCPHSRHAGVSTGAHDRAVARGELLALARADDAGPTVFATPDLRLVGHLGHPEYEASRLVLEWERDRAKGRKDVRAPRGLDLELPATTWAHHTATLFERWLDVAVRNAR